MSWLDRLGSAGSVREILVNVVASILFVGMGALTYRFVYLPVRRRANLLSWALPFDRKKKIVVVSYGLLDPSATKSYYMVEEGDLAAINVASAGLIDTYGEEDVLTQNCFVTEAQLGEVSNVLAISGPRWNRVSELFLGRMGSPITFDKIESLVVTPREGPEARYQAIKRADGQEHVCFGAVIASTAESAAGFIHRVVVCAGLNNLSTYGAVVFLMSLRTKVTYHGLPWAQGRLRGSWAVVLRVENTTNPAAFMPYQLPLDPNHIKIDVVQVLHEDQFADPYVYRY